MPHSSLRPLPSRLLKIVFAVGLVTAPVWGIGTLTLPPAGAGQVLGGGFLTATTTLPTCLGGTVGPCVDTAFVSTTLATTASVFLKPGSFNGTPPPQIYPVVPGGAASALATAFAAGPTGGFTLALGGALPVNINVTNFSTVTTDTVGGMTIQANATYIPTVPAGTPPNPGNPNNVGPAGTTALPNLNQLVWTQITYDNYFPPSTKTKPATLLDSYKNNGGTGGPPPGDPNNTSFNQACVALPALPAGGAPAAFPAGGAGVNGATGKTNAYCDPIYPFQDGNAGFSDTPTGGWAVPASFRAIDFLSSISLVGGVSTLTIYDNAINYGFDLVTPEPSFKILLLMAMLLIVALSRRRTATS